ncbi:MAG: carboxypeptidase regulatory-like domain-containing protein [Ignavibacteriaceae bacterium]
MKNKYCSLLAAILFIAVQNITNAQVTAYYSAVTKDTSGQILPNVYVQATGAEPVYSNYNGEFQLKFYSLLYDSAKSATYANLTCTRLLYDTLQTKIYINNGDSIKGPDIILTPKPKPKTVMVSGKVEYDNGQGFNDAFIWLQNITGDNSYATRTDIYGNYSIAVDSGAYYLDAYVSYIQGNMLTNRSQYYNNKQSFNDADIAVFRNDTSNINFIFPTLTLCSISGTIRDAITLKPLSNVFIAVNSSENHDSTFIGTDQNGKYNIQVFEGSYTLYAYQQGYIFEYYKDVFNSFDATPVIVNKDSSNATGIDFNLTKPNPGSNSISGLVGDPTWLAGVEVYAIPANGGTWTGTKSGNDGRFSIANLKSGKYVLLFYLDGYKSQYYGDSLNTINLTGNMSVSNIFVIMEKLNSIGGEISGVIKSNSDSPLSGTLLLAVDSLGDTASTSITNYSGYYTIPSLPNGNYSVIANKIGYEKVTYPQKVDINLTSNPIVTGINISIIPTGVNNGISNLPKAYALYQNYPNPFNPSTIISYSVPKSSVVTIKVYDVLGREVRTLVNEQKMPGNYKITFNAGNLASGVYFYQLKSSNYTSTKNMLLLK